MSHETVLAALSKLSKIRVWHTAPKEFASHVLSESARSVIILNGSAIEHMLGAQIEERVPGLNSDEKSRIFGPEGPIGTFSNKISMAKGLQIIDRHDARRADIVRCMRNAAAHCVSPVRFSDEAFKDAVAQLTPSDLRPKVKALDEFGLRHFFVLTCMSLSSTINGRGPTGTPEELYSQVYELARPGALLDKPAG